MSQFDTILVRTDGPVATLSLNRPEVRNAMNPAMMGEIQNAFETFNNNDEIRVVVIRGEGRVFCAGGDLYQAVRGDTTYNLATQMFEIAAPYLGPEARAGRARCF